MKKRVTSAGGGANSSNSVLRHRDLVVELCLAVWLGSLLLGRHLDGELPWYIKLVDFANSNFFLSNSVLSILEKTLTILPPVLLKIVNEDAIKLASSKLTLLENLLNATSADKPYDIS